MSISTSTNYTGRKKDISIFHSPDPLLVGAQNVSIGFGRSPKYCAGLQKTIQRYAIILLTNIESQPNFTDFGTNFLISLQGSNSSVDTLQASQIFNLASYDAIAALKAYQAEREDIPEDERIVSATLSSITSYGGSASFDINVTTEAGAVVNFLIPLPK